MLDICLHFQQMPLKLIAFLNKKLNLSGYKEDCIKLVNDRLNLEIFLKKMNLSKPSFYSKFKDLSLKKFIVKLSFCMKQVEEWIRGVFMFENKKQFQDYSRLINHL